MRRTLAFLVVLLAAAPSLARGGPPLLLQRPAVNRSHVVFVYGDALWRVPRAGGRAERLTTGPAQATDPTFSPDGTLLAYTGIYDGNADVYVMPAEGGQPRRLTYHPGGDGVAGWTPDGKSILFYSGRSSHTPRFVKLFTVPVEGGFPTELPLPMAARGSFSPDGQRIAYVPVPPAFRIWKHYRGGLASHVWIADLADSRIEKIPREDSNDFNPMWVGDKVYFLSDRNGPVTLFAFDTQTRKVRQVLENRGLDLKSASAGPGAIVYEQFGSLHLFDPETEKSQPLDVRVDAELPALRPRFAKAAKQIHSADVSPTGARVVFEARGEILTVPAAKGDPRNLTNTPGVVERDPAWSPDGKKIAYLTEESGEYTLRIRDSRGEGPVKDYTLGRAPSFYYAPRWSPDGKKIAYTDKRLNLWTIDLDSGTNTLVDTDTFDAETRTLDPVWSPDGRWLAYTKSLDNLLHAVFLYPLDGGKPRQLTDGQSDARFPAFDRSGKYLYFTASTDIGPAASWNDMSGFNHPVTRGVYVVVLRDDLPSPLARESDEEKGKDDATAGAKAAPANGTVRVDWDRIGQRVLALPVPAKNYTGLVAGKEGVFYLTEGEQIPSIELRDFLANPSDTLHRFDLAKRQLTKLAGDVANLRVAHDGEKLLYRQKDSWHLVPAGQPAGPGEGVLNTGALEVRVDPRAEWRQMFREVWRLERDFLYDPNHHGYDLKAAEKRYEPFLDGLASRSDLNYLFGEMLGGLTLGHVYVQGGDVPETAPAKGGLLGADYAVENGRYRFARVYEGENWNPQLRAPLTVPGVNVKEGEYLLAVDGHDLRPPENLYRLFEGTAGRSVTLRVGPDPGGKGAREVTVEPVASEAALRNHSWIEGNRRKVEKMTDGKVGYVYLPDTWAQGFSSFNRYFFAQTGKDGAVIDERFNGGGYLADYMIDAMRRSVVAHWTSREGKDVTTPMAGVFGPKAMIINEYAGSGGDALPWMFRRANLGPLVGKRTWGGLVGIYDNPPLLDGGGVTAPRQGFWTPEGKWEVENRGVPPDVEVDLDPYEVRRGHDPQLEKAVEIVLEELKKNPPKKPQRPAFPNYYPAKAKATENGQPASPGGR